MAPDHEIFELGAVTLQSGDTLPDAKLAYKTYGSLNARGDNAIVMPTFFTGTHVRNEGYLRAVPALDPSRYFIVSIDMFGNGLSSSPSNTAPPFDGPRFPAVTLYDNVVCQNRLLTRALGVTRIALVLGWSMAGCQSYQWGAQYPDMVDAILPFCASARTSPHNKVFLEGVKAALTADNIFAGGDYTAPPEAGLRAFGRVYAGWAYSQAFYRERLHRARLRDLGRTASRLGAGSPRLGRQRSAGQAPYVAAGRHQRQRALSGRLRTRTRRDPGARDPRPLHDGSLLPAGGQRHRGGAHAQRRAQALRVALGPLRGVAEPRGQRLHALPGFLRLGAAGGLRALSAEFPPHRRPDLTNSRTCSWPAAAAEPWLAGNAGS